MKFIIIRLQIILFSSEVQLVDCLSLPRIDIMNLKICWSAIQKILCILGGSDYSYQTFFLVIWRHGDSRKINITKSLPEEYAIVSLYSPKITDSCSSNRNVFWFSSFPHLDVCFKTFSLQVLPFITIAAYFLL